MKTYDCPACGVAVEAKADYLARGLKCPSCGTGFIPERIETRPLRMPGKERKPTATGFFVTATIVTLAGAFVLWNLFGLIGVGIGLSAAFVILLAGIFVRLGKNSS